MRRSFSVFLLLLAPLLISCIRIETEAPYTPVPVPPELEGVGWAEFPARYCIVQDGQGFVDDETMVELTQRAFDEWRGGIEYDGPCPGPAGESNGRNEIHWGQINNSEGPGHEAGLTRIQYRQTFPARITSIVEADITIDTDPPPRRDSEGCLFSTLLHEAGHFLGVQHLSPPAIMAPVITSCRDELTDADREALNLIYRE